MSGYTHSNKNNRRQHYHKEAQKKASMRREEENLIREENSKQKKINKQTKRKERSKPDHSNSETVMLCTDFQKLLLEVPIKFNLFGKLTKNSKQLLFNLIDKNKEWLNYNEDFYEMPIVEITFKDIDKFINKLSKFKNYENINSLDYRNFSKPYFFYKYTVKSTKKSDWMFAINLGEIYDKYIAYNFKQLNRIPVYIQIDPLIYNNVKLEKVNSYPDNCRLGFYNCSSAKSKYIPEVEHGYVYRVYVQEKDKINQFRTVPKEFCDTVAVDYFHTVSIKKIRTEVHK